MRPSNRGIASSHLRQTNERLQTQVAGSAEESIPQVSLWAAGTEGVCGCDDLAASV